MGDVTVTDGGLNAYLERLQRLASGEWREALFDRIGARLHALVQGGWDNEADPTGAAWATTDRNNPILDETGAMRGSTGYEVTASGVTLTVADFKAAFHQYGTRRGIVPRRMLPEDVLPPAWEAAIREEVEAFFTEYLKGG